MAKLIEPPTLDDLESRINASEQQTELVSAHEIRDMCDESRLKALARERIQDKLQQRGLVALPHVPGHQDSSVYITRSGSGIYKLWTALDAPSDAGLKILRGAASNAGPVVHEQRAIEEVAALVDEASELIKSVVGNGRPR